MITPELIGYMRGEFAKGKTREEIRGTLISEGGWNEVDLNEAFRAVIPMQSHPAENLIQNSAQNFVRDSVQDSVLVAPKIKLSLLKISFVVIIVGSLGFAAWRYRSPIISFWNSSLNKLSELSLPSFSLPSFDIKKIFGINNNASVIDNLAVENNPAAEATNNIVKDCGASARLDLKNPDTYQNNAVLTCLGNSALRCEEARGVLTDVLFPTIFQVVKNQDTCNFKLSYGEDSTLIDITGKKLALQYVSCPIGLVKALDETNPQAPLFKSPNFDDLSQYASQIYFYGTLGLFMENDVDQNKIQALGCSGPYIDSVVESYRQTRSKE